MEEPLTTFERAAQPTLWYGCVSCDRFLIWRGEGSSRCLWKACCSCCLFGEFLVYCYLVRALPLLVLFGCLTLIKFLVEIWGQETPTWMCPGGPFMFLVVYELIFPGFIYLDGLCTKNEDIVFPHRDVLGAVLFLCGSLYSLSYEVGRFRWKKLQEHRGKLHMEGLAKYCILPNYFGDLFTSSWLVT
eukprot:TRINITY_DN42869_c0_g1_i1.p1 TRINITY_DN42869_c0_g1~~TRINITY_DN42869_c0_g1_i1.p1  ORF type:complete len:187 (+),score=9.13 TRINITY_DN42869_c0_g1_i1:66-626(+)